MKKQNLHSQKSEATRVELIGAARYLFTERGFGGVTSEEIVQRAGMSRGALYHHFGGKGVTGGKEGLFAALYEELQAEIAASIEDASAGLEAWAALRAGCFAFLDACLDPTIRRVVLLDAPTVLGWEHWREVDARYGLGSLKEGLREAMEAGHMRSQPVEPISHLLLGAMNEAAMWIARSQDPETSLERTRRSLDELLEGLRTQT